MQANPSNENTRTIDFQQETVFQNQVRQKGEEIFQRMGDQKTSIFNKDWWYGSIMEWSMKNPQFKTQMFRFVDVLPTLESGSEVARHLKEYFAEGGEELPKVFNVGLGLGSLAPGLMASAIRKNVTQMAKMFITGETPEEAISVLKKQRKNQLTFTVDILGEATLSEVEAKDYLQRYLHLMDELSSEAAKWNEDPIMDRDHQGSIPKVNVSVKLTALDPQVNDRAWDLTKQRLKDRLRPLFAKAMEKNLFLDLDMEHYGVKHLTLEVFQEILMEPNFRTYPYFGCVIQAYLKDSFQDVQSMIQFAKVRGTPLTVRLVKGAYWDSETIEAQQKDWTIPVYTVKAETDANYERCAEELLKNFPWIRVAIASHNVRSLAFAITSAEKYQVPKLGFEIQMLYGMAEPIKKSIVGMGYRVREYAPVGDLLPGMAYLVRRLLENTSNEGFLKTKFADGASHDQLLKDPRLLIPATNGNAVAKKEIKFSNEPLLDFAIEQNRRYLQQALKNLESELPVVVPVHLAGSDVRTHQITERKNPSQSSQVVAQVCMASVEQVHQAVATAKSVLPSWKKTSADVRANYLEKLAHLMQRDRFQLMATQILEVGKPWAEADADVAEAIDFCRYYALQMRQLGSVQYFGNIAGEENAYHYQARGVTAVIAPWNFPLAILTGMATAAAVTGNTVIMKPAEQSSLVAAGLMKLMQEAGFPAGVIQNLPGLGETVGAALVDHPDVHTIVFTGSKAVGLSILQKAAVVHPGQQHIKKVILELGGKNAIIVDTDADLDEAVDGVVHSAFGFSGQKCSACSRVIVLQDVYEKFVTRLMEATRSLVQAAAQDPQACLGPVVDEDSYQRLMSIVQAADATASSGGASSPVSWQKAQRAYQAMPVQGGYFVPPTIFTDVQATDPLAQQEFFGPVLAVIKARDMSEAIQILNQTEYALTAGLYSRSPSNIAKAREEIQCGNLYINRGITGAMVQRQPFGGFKLSGVGSKAGGPDYLQQFMEPRCITENQMRRGFAPTPEV
jgi:RHH-type proline utilization regulon transcriptional repressor/proline dehydrogenase/delta 1-pyrroline-5-carboxylate dehydrogenase